ncbi:MAG: hypothetical protein KDI33_00395 [Halioglobus sp.]|nr:hypothetical protein [Halioglobus sp.]
MQAAIPCTVMRGGTSKGLYFLASDLPADSDLRDANCGPGLKRFAWRWESA